ncbi:right-handed parallel beta-helix repeat-containing protein [Coraliomargarita sp. SDUM461004]|uniref:Right-handed parallel beta-helix repeat-containing protein n=1 Tax=Thalassobacterium sedimentorum TaxID=3041258 RepID=A0ABU1AH93_9BACT|nr:right-handed parallel beta-helix repeat-containing protein [Coraliomargarita sp. SDUM461004]MDQ8194158.1 right-handed parallel beta-helix repeat-containing protein [Coraliomargarita sp. SDUM461004]
MPSRIAHFATLLSFAGLFCGLPASALEFHVAQLGDDESIGTIDQPFKTVSRAKAQVRKEIAKGLRQNIIISLHQGVYELSEPLIFSPEDSGTEVFSITYTAHKQDTVILSGGRQVTNWKADKTGRWSADLPRVKAGKWFFRQLVVNDQRATRARWPNTDGDLSIETVSEDVKTFSFNQSLPSASLSEQNAELVVFQHWSISRGRVIASDNQHVTTATPMGWIGHGPHTTTVPERYSYIEHTLAGLDKPGEWFLDSTSGTLHYIPRQGETRSNTIAVAPHLERLIVIEGTKDSPVRNIHFQGIQFEDTDFPLPDIGYNEIQAAHYGTTIDERIYVHPVAIECSWAEGIQFERCRFAHFNSSAIGLGPGAHNNSILGCQIEDIGGNGIMIGWRGKGELEGVLGGRLESDWADPSDAPTGNEVSNCHIRQCGQDSRGSCGIFVAFTANTRIAHNHIHDMPYTGVTIGFRWSPKSSTQTNCLVENNHIHNVMKQLADGGAIYTLGVQPQTTFRGNHIHDVERRPEAIGWPNNGFFMDQSSSGFLFEQNVVYQTAGSALRFNESKHEWHTWKDNFFENQASEAAQAIIDEAGIKKQYRSH